jgi:septal ring factor EnvC (AmiA/AmiB activator)
MSGEVFKTEQLIKENEAVLASLQEDMQRLKEEYARMIRFAYQNRSAYDRLSYVFAAESFAQAFKRSRYLARIAEYRQRQAELIQQTQEVITAKVAELKGLRDQRTTLLNEQVAAKKELTQDRSEHQSNLSNLKKEEGRLKDQLKKQEKQKRDLEARIRKAIEDAMPKPPKGAGTANNKLDITLTPEAKALGADMEKNRGKLPWPVERGVITGHFGRHPHPVLDNVMVELNGVDITTEKNATVRAVFRGEVTSVIVIPGAGKVVIVSHGAYRSVYSNLREASVTKGQKVDTKQAIGTVMTSDDGNVAHLEVWKVTADGMVKTDPELWLYKE